MTPTRIALILGASAVVLSVALKAAFDIWVADRFIFWDDDVIGFSPYAWAFLSLMAICTLGLASGGIGTRRRILGVVAFAFVGVLWVLVFDNVLGALTDGAVSSTGLAIGLLAIAQVGVLSVWLAFVWRWATIRR